MNIDETMLSSKSVTRIIQLMTDLVILISPTRMGQRQDLVNEYEDLIDKHQERLDFVFGKHNYKTNIDKCLNYKRKEMR